MKHRRRSTRLKGYDYSLAGAYFVTICTWRRETLFGEVAKGEMRLNEVGKIAAQEWRRTDQIRPYVSLDAFIVMPNHVHGIIFLHDDVGATGRSPYRNTRRAGLRQNH